MSGQEPAAPAPGQGFDAGETIIGHVSNSSPDHPLIHLPTIYGIDLSVSKHVFMLLLVAALFVGVTDRAFDVAAHGADRRGNRPEVVVEFVRDGIVRPNVGDKWVRTWTPLVLTLFVFILGMNMIGLIPIFEVLGLVDHLVLHSPDGGFVKNTPQPNGDGNHNVTAALAIITFISIIVAAPCRVRPALEESSAHAAVLTCC
jgi:F0F1-type ATP synthase membrane subunit a